MQPYETLFIVDPSLEESEISKAIDIIQNTITTGGGKILKVDKWGTRQLAYEIRKKREGYYVLIYFEAPPSMITELNRRYKLTDPIMRNLILQLRKDQIEEVMRSNYSTENGSSLKLSYLLSDEEYGEEDEKSKYDAEFDEAVEMENKIRKDLDTFTEDE